MSYFTRANAIARQTRVIRAQNLSPAQTRVAVALANRWDGDLDDRVVIAAAIDLDAQGPQWAFKIDNGYFLDIARDAIAAATAKVA